MAQTFWQLRAIADLQHVFRRRRWRGFRLRQQVEDAKAAAAEEQGEAKTITITKELIRYVQTPNRVKCDPPLERVQLRARAAANASNIPGFDGEAVPDGNAGK
jgi:hypothetical protein